MIKKKVLIYEASHQGHYFQYVSHLLRNAQLMCWDVNLCISQLGTESCEYEEWIRPFLDSVKKVHIVPYLPSHRPRSHNLVQYQALMDAVKKCGATHVVIPSGDNFLAIESTRRLSGKTPVTKLADCEIGFHHGLGKAATTFLERLKDLRLKFLMRTGGWRKIHCVNRLFYQHIAESDRKLSTRVRHLPHPVDSGEIKDRFEARKLLGINPYGKVVGFAGMIDRRKAIPEMLNAFVDANLSQSDYVLLAGTLSSDIRSTIAGRYSHLLESKRLVLLDRYLSNTDLSLAFSAVDVAVVPYLNFPQLSATVLNGVAAGRPVIVHNYGWSADTVDKYHLGAVCDIRNCLDFSDAIRRCLKLGETDWISDEVRGLLEFHSSINFAKSWLS